MTLWQPAFTLAPPPRAARATPLPAPVLEEPRPLAVGVSSPNYPGASRPGGFSAEEILSLLLARLLPAQSSADWGVGRVAMFLAKRAELAIDPCHASSPWPGIILTLPGGNGVLHASPVLVARCMGALH